MVTTPTISITLNGTRRSIAMSATTRTLMTVLRDDLGLTGTKDACSQGVCGSCTVLIDGAPARACLILTATLDGASVTTIEGLGSTEAPGPVQQAFIDAGAIQCGFCMPGMIIQATSLLRTKPRPSRDEIRHAISGNLCRCSGYAKVIEAVELAASRIAP
ncbi:MAG: (2Fe-2S)-binding protein [Alphaproteobacteria bacterium]|nr:(2Fe-2S)-binding protein [Alphaproteobacteria bacterium]